MRILAIVIALTFSLPAAAEVIGADAPYRRNPPGTIEVQYLIGPQGRAGKDVAVNRLNLRAQASVPEHVHADADEILVFIAGGGTITLEGNARAVKAGDTVFIPRGMKHAFAADGTPRTETVQIYQPAGPEARFKDWPLATGGGL